MTPPVKPPRLTRAEATEARIVAAATTLFVERGYRSTTMSDVAALAGVADRTVYVRFATKADVLKRAIDVAVVGDTRPVPLADRDWPAVAMSAPTLEERLRADAAGSTALFIRLAPVVSVALQVEADEAVISEAVRAGREGTWEYQRAFWSQLHADGLLHDDADLAWMITTAGLLGTVETYLAMTRTTPASDDDYERWRYRTWWHLATTPGPKAARPSRDR